MPLPRLLPPCRRPWRRLPWALAPLLVVAGAAAPAKADVVTTRQGLTLEGSVERLPDGGLRVTTPDGPVTLAASEVAGLTPGDGPRTRFARLQAQAAPSTSAAWYRLALEAEALGLSDEARQALTRVLSLEPEHAAARRALGHERVEGRWLPADEARRRRGLVLYAGAWRLPEEVEAAQSLPAPAGARAAPATTDPARLTALLNTLAGEDAALAAAARRSLAGVPTRDLVEAALGLLSSPHARVRATCCRLLGEWGDESALRALLFHGARDLDADVRREAVLAAQSFGHDDVAIPFVRALGSSSVQLVANAAQAIALLGDQRAAGYVVKRLESHGAGTRQFVSFLNQISYVRDYDVEIAQASNIANPNIGMILEGVVLDVHVKGASYTETWVEPYLVDALSRLTGQRFANAAEARAWYAAHGKDLPQFPQVPAPRAPRRGSVVGAGAPGAGSPAR